MRSSLFSQGRWHGSKGRRSQLLRHGCRQRSRRSNGAGCRQVGWKAELLQLDVCFSRWCYVDRDLQDMSGAQTVTGTQVSKRVAAGAPGSHAISGSWKTEKMPDVSDVGATVTYKMTPDGLQMGWNGQSYDAKFDGKKYLTANDPGKTWVSLRRISDSTIDRKSTRLNSS